MNAPFVPPAHPPATAQNLAALPLIEKWISLPTVSRDSNLPLIEWTRDYLASHGVESHLVHDETGRKANLWATLPADSAVEEVERNFFIRQPVLWQ